MKRIITLCLTMLLLMTALPVVLAENAALSCKVDYDKSTITVTYQTPTRYRQRVSFVLYPAELTNPEPQQLTRMCEVTADREGVAVCLFTLTDDDPVGLYTIEAQGGGYAYADSHAVCEKVEFKTQKYINETLLPRFSIMKADEADAAFREEKNVLGLTLDEAYEVAKDEIAALFVSARNDDFPNGFSAVSEITETLSVVDLLRNIYKADSAAALQELLESAGKLSRIDFTDADYKTYTQAIYTRLYDMMHKTQPQSRTDINEQYMACAALTAIYDKNAETMTAAITKYAKTFGIDAADYKALCKQYGETEVNKAFVAGAFTETDDVLAAYITRRNMLQQGKDSGSSSAASGGTGSGGKSYSGSISGGQILKPDPVTKAEFTDLKQDHWAFAAVVRLQNRGVISGFEDGSFRPEMSVTREQFVKMLSALLGLSGGSASFNDVPENHWARPYIAAAAAAGIIAGRDDNSFGTGEGISRQDAAVMLFRGLSAMGITLQKTQEVSFGDADTISRYAQAGVSALAEAGVISGMEDGRFAPQEGLTRAQAAQLLSNLLMQKEQSGGETK